VKKLVFVVFAIITLTACSSANWNNDEHSYLKNRNGALIEVPRPLTSSNLGHFYDLPPQTQDPRVSISPPVEIITA
jgi:uncharacterized lipoprotein